MTVSVSSGPSRSEPAAPGYVRSSSPASALLVDRSLVVVELGVSGESLRTWLRQEQLDRGERDDGVTTAERDELRKLRRQVRELEREREILKRAVAPSARYRNIDPVVELEVEWWQGLGGRTRRRSGGSCGSGGGGVSRSVRSAGRSRERPAPFIARSGNTVGWCVFFTHHQSAKGPTFVARITRSGTGLRVPFQRGLGEGPTYIGSPIALGQ